MIDEQKIKSTLKKTEKLAEIYECKLNLGFSGGKDSVVLKYFADYYGIDYVGNFNNTQIESYKGMIGFIKENYPSINIIHPDKENSFFELMKKNGLPSLFRRWCCEYIKHSNPKLNEYRVNIMGVRGEESNARLKRGAISVFGNSKRATKKLAELRKTFASTSSEISCSGGKDKVNVYPIFDLTEKEIWEVIKVENLKIPDIYATQKRIGCAFCPFASTHENYETIKSQPNLAKMWIKTLNQEFILKTQRNVYGKTDSIGLFYLYINVLLLRNVDFAGGINYLNSKDIFGKTGYEKFTDFLKQNKIL